jgi:hypothetical protein
MTDQPATICPCRHQQSGGYPEHTKVFATTDAAEKWLEENEATQLRRPYESHSEMALATITMMTMARPVSSHGMSLRSRGVTGPSSYCGALKPGDRNQSLMCEPVSACRAFFSTASR